MAYKIETLFKNLVRTCRALLLQGTLRPAQQEAGAGLAQGKLVRGTAQRSPSADRDSGDSEPESLACLSSGWRLQEI